MRPDDLLLCAIIALGATPAAVMLGWVVLDWQRNSEVTRIDRRLAQWRDPREG